MKLEEAITGLIAGRVLCFDRKDNPLLPDMYNLESIGLVSSEIVQVDEQGSVIKFRWERT